MAMSGNDNTTPANAGVEEVQRVADDDRSVKESRAGEALAKKLGISIEELDRRLQSEDKQRDAAGLPPLAWSQVADRATLDDFAPDPGPPSKLIQGQQPEQAKDGMAVGDAEKSKDSRSVAGNKVEDQSLERAKEAEEIRLAREQRQREAMQAMNKRFNVVGGDFYDKGDRTRLVFADKGSKLVGFDSDAATAKAMATMAEGKGWSTIKVGGTEKFKREVWLEASLRGVQVQGYKPKEADLAALQERREQSATNKVYQVNEPTKKWLVQEKAENGLYKDMFNTDDARKAHLAFIEKENRRIIDNRIKDYAADYAPRHDTRTGETKLEPDYHKRSSFAQEAGVERATRTDKGRVVEAVASATVTATVQNPAVREKVMQEVNRQLDKRTAEGRVPVVQVYDVKAPAKQREQAPVVQRDKQQDRTR